MSGVRVKDGRTLPWFQVTKAETAQLAMIAEPRSLPLLRSLYFALLELANDQRSDEVPASRAELAQRSGISPATVKRLTPILVGGGLVRVEEHPGYASVWTVLGVGSTSPGGSGLADPGVGSTGPALKETAVQEELRTKKESPTDSCAITEVWEHYQATRPHGSRCKLGPYEQRVIKAALVVADAAECKAAITGLFRSDYHVAGGYVHIKYALRGGGHGPSPRATIDRLSAIASGAATGHANGGGQLAGVLREHLYGGVPFDDLSRGEQRNIVEAWQMGIEPWDGAAREEPAPARANGKSYTSHNFAD